LHRKCRKQWAVVSGQSSVVRSPSEIRWEKEPINLQELPERKFLPVRRGWAHGTTNKIRGGRFMTNDPVCGMQVDENTSPHSQYGGKKYSFCSEECRDNFEKTPEQFVQSAA
jgi:YHS domain-containing protein